MTANELADWIENGAPFGDYETAKKAVTMLRQQQVEIEALRLRELTDEEIEHIAQQHLTVHVQFIGAGDCTIEGEIEFARAILKKAREK